VDNVYTSELVDNSAVYGVPLENKFTVYIFWSLPCKKGKWVVQEEDGENRIIWKRIIYTRRDLELWATSTHDGGDRDYDDDDDISGCLFAAVTETYNM